MTNTKNRRYLPHEVQTRIAAVKCYNDTHDINYTLRKYHISRASLWRWRKRYDGSRESLEDGSHRPLSPHPCAHTALEIKWIADYHRRNPNISVPEMYGKLVREKGYSRSIRSLSIMFKRLGFRKPVVSTKVQSRHNKPYDTPALPGVKWQCDVKYVPAVCYVGSDESKFYQYTMIEEATRERFIYYFQEINGYNTVRFCALAFKHFGYIPAEIQTDNGPEFSYPMHTKRVHLFDRFCDTLGIYHHTIRPRTPWHNGKVERSHRTDQERFYNFLRFYNFEDLRKQGLAWLRRSNDIPMAVLGWKSPLEFRSALPAPAPLSPEQKRTIDGFLSSMARPVFS